MKNKLLLVAFIFTINFSFSQRNSPWKPIENNQTITAEKVRTTAYSASQRLFEFNKNQFKQALENVPLRSSNQAGILVQLPNSKGVLEKL